jgi:protein-tyrosine phosphatase
MAIIDVHCHILPGVDDGARNVETSLAMLKASSDQGVQYMVATPHFYATRDRVETFLDRRSEAWETLKPQMNADFPKIYLGAEVAFFQGISRADRLEQLRIEGTNCILLEMPFRPWSEGDVDEVSQIYEKHGYTIILAHIERYLAVRANADYIEDLLEMPVLAQINAESLLDWRQRGMLIKMVRNGQIHLLGSDCHGIRHRPPNLGEGRAVLRKKLGQACLDRIDGLSEELLLQGAEALR